MENQKHLERNMLWAHCDLEDFVRVENLYKKASKSVCREIVSDNLLSYAGSTKLIGALAAAGAGYLIGNEVCEAVGNYPDMVDHVCGGIAAAASYLVARKPLFRAGLDLGIRKSSSKL